MIHMIFLRCPRFVRMYSVEREQILVLGVQDALPGELGAAELTAVGEKRYASHLPGCISRDKVLTETDL